MSDEPTLCANPDCRQPLLLAREGRTLCARCERAAGIDSWQWVNRADPSSAGEAVALGVEEGSSPVPSPARDAAERLAATVRAAAVERPRED